MTGNDNQSAYFSFRTNPSLGDALADINPGDEFKVEVTLQCLSKDDKGISCDVVPGTVVPEGFVLEDNPTADEIQKTPSPEPPGSLSQQPITVLTSLRRKGSTPTSKGY